MLSHISNRPRVANLVLVTLISHGIAMWDRFFRQRPNIGITRSRMRWCVRKKYLTWVKTKGASKKCLSLAITDCQHSASLVMPIGDPRDRFFYPSLILMMDTYYLWWDYLTWVKTAKLQNWCLQVMCTSSLSLVWYSLASNSAGVPCICSLFSYQSTRDHVCQRFCVWSWITLSSVLQI